MHLDPARPAQPHHPDEPGAGRQQFGDLGAQLGLVLPAAGVFHRQRRRAGNPAAGFLVGRGRGHGDVGRVQSGGVGAEPGVHTRPGDVRIAVDDGSPGQMGRGVIAPGGGAVERVAVGEFVTVAFAELVGAERAGFWLAVAMWHGESPDLRSALRSINAVCVAPGAGSSRGTRAGWTDAAIAPVRACWPRLYRPRWSRCRVCSV